MKIDIYDMPKNPLHERYKQVLNRYPSIRFGMASNMSIDLFGLLFLMPMLPMALGAILASTGALDHWSVYSDMSRNEFGMYLVIISYALIFVLPFTIALFEVFAWFRIQKRLTDEQVKDIARFVDLYAYECKRDGGYHDLYRQRAESHPEECIEQLLSSNKSKQRLGLRYALGRGAHTFASDLKYCNEFRRKCLDEQRARAFRLNRGKSYGASS